MPHHRHDDVTVAEAAGQEDDLGIEDDAPRSQAAEDVAARVASEALEATLRVRHVAGHPDAGDATGRHGPAGAGRCGWLARRSDPSGWMRLPSARSYRRSASVSSGIWSGGVAMSASVKMMRSPRGGEDARRDGRPFAAVWPAQHAQAHRAAVVGHRGDLRLRPGLHDGDGVVVGAIVDDEDVPLPELVRGSTKGARLSTAPKPAEELVESRPDAMRLVVGRQHDGDAGMDRRRGHVGCWSVSARVGHGQVEHRRGQRRRVAPASG